MKYPLAGVVMVSAVLAGAAGAVEAVCTITGDYTVECDGVTYRAVDDECLHYVNLAQHNQAHPTVALPDLKKTVADNYADPAAIQPVVVQLTDFVDCTKTDHNFTDANIVVNSPRPNKPSRLMNISGKTFRVTAAPDNGFATYYYSYDVLTGGEAAVPHLLISESSNDQERYTSVAIHHPDGISINYALPYAPPYSTEPTLNPWGNGNNFTRTEQEWVFGPDVGVAMYTGRELPIDNQPFNIKLLFHPKTSVVRVVVSSLGCNVQRRSTDGGAVSRMWVFKFVDAMAERLPALQLPDAPQQQRHIGIYMTHPWYFYMHYGTPPRVLGHRQQSLQRLMDHMKYCGFNYVMFNAINGADRSVKAWYNDSAHFPWNSAGNLLTELPPVAQNAGVELVPLITSLIVPPFSGGLSFTSESYQMGSDGQYHRAFGSPGLDPLRPEVQQLTKNLLIEMATRTASSPAVRGLGIRVNGKIGTCYISDSDRGRSAKLAGYSQWDLQQFKQDTGSAVPSSSPQQAYNWLIARPVEWEKWINWRCAKTREFWLSCRDLIKSYRPDWTFYVQCDLPSETPGTNVEWTAGETPYNLLRYHGYDPEMFANDSGIIISRGMMVAADRFFVSSRWGAPWGSNYQNYRLFHYAPGLPELYRTAEGRACEFYQNYWEETFNPYYEYGSPPDPNGFFRTHTPAAFDRSFFSGATMSVRRQDPDTMVWLGWQRPTLGHEAEIRKFAQAFRALPVAEAVEVDGTVTPAIEGVAARWHGNRLAVINDTSTARTIQIQFADPIPAGEEFIDVVTGRKLLTAESEERSMLSVPAEAYSLNVFVYTGTPPDPPPPPPPPPPVPGVDNPSFELAGGSYNGWEIVHISDEGPDIPPWSNTTNQWNVITPAGEYFGGKITSGLRMNFYLGQVVGASDFNHLSEESSWQLSALVQLHARTGNPSTPMPAGVHQVWELGWNFDGSEPQSIMTADHYQVIASLDGTHTGNSSTTFSPLNLNGVINLKGLRGVVVRVRFFNDGSYSWTHNNIDNLQFVLSSVLPSIPGDMDGDRDVDMVDFGRFHACMTGQGVPQTNPECESALLDGDDDVDQVDFGLFQRCLSGSGVGADPGCAGPN